MLTTLRKPASVAEILVEEFMEPLGLTQTALAQAMGVPRKHGADGTFTIAVTLISFIQTCLLSSLSEMYLATFVATTPSSIALISIFLDFHDLLGK